CNVLLRIAAFHAERMKLHQLTRIVLVEASWDAVQLRRPLLNPWQCRSSPRPSRPRPECVPTDRRVELRAVRIDAHPVVEVKKHGRTLGGRFEQIPEGAEDVRANRFPFVLSQKKSHAPLSRIGIEMIEPEIRQDLLQLPL